MKSPQPPAHTPSPPLVEVRDLAQHFPLRRGLFRQVVGAVRAVDGVSFALEKGRTLGLVGESGSGKTTLARCLLRLIEPTAGSVLFEGEPLLAASRRRLRGLRARMQLIFQDPAGALNPRMTVEGAVGEGLMHAGVRSRRTRRERVADALARVGLDARRHLTCYPHELSGGQRQRVGIARALVLRPRLIVCDEAVSSLDVSLEAQILNLLAQLQAEEGFTYLFISHDLSVVRHISDRVGVLYLGRLVELGPASRLYEEPHHPYTRALLASTPASHPARRGRSRVLGGETPSAAAPPGGCRFHGRCPQVQERCRIEEPGPVEIGPGHVSWCFLPPGGP